MSSAILVARHERIAATSGNFPLKPPGYTIHGICATGRRMRQNIREVQRLQLEGRNCSGYRQPRTWLGRQPGSYARKMSNDKVVPEVVGESCVMDSH